jgi:tetratricopeptide (TPR) repeat protein
MKKRLAKAPRDSLAARLENALVQREVRAAFALFDSAFKENSSLSPAKPSDFDLLVLLAQCVDLGYRSVDFFSEQLVAFETHDPSKLTAGEYFRLKLAQAFRMIATRRAAEAHEQLSALIEIGLPLLTPPLRFLAHFLNGRALRQVGDFQSALEEIHHARAEASAMQAEKLSAVVKIHESWLVFHKGERRFAFDLLDQAEEILRPTEHALSLGNIEAARGRFIRHSGQYAKALIHFERAIEIYGPSYASHPNLARALVNAAYIKRLMTLETNPGPGVRTTAASHARTLRTAQEAMQLLERAEKIYALHQHQAGAGSVLINRAHIKLETGDIQSAIETAEAACHLAAEKQDAPLLVRARILQAYTQMACSDEEIDEPLTPFSPAQRALELAHDAVSLAVGGQHRQLLAAAYITRGLASADPSIADWSGALSDAEKAQELLDRNDHDHLIRELNRLRRKIAQSQGTAVTLQRWLDGDFKGKTFQQVEEEFAQLVIPRVWNKLNRSVARVAKELSVSPKKVRRALENSRDASLALEDDTKKPATPRR